MTSQSSTRLQNLSNQLSLTPQPISSQSNILFTDNIVPKVTISKPKLLNSLNIQMIRDLSKVINKIQKYPVFWIEGAGGKAFCAGGDVKALWEGNANAESRETFFREEFTLDYQIGILKSIQIVNWSGIVMGGGVGISHLAPFRIATQKTVFAMPEAKIGFYIDVGSGYTLSRLRNNIGTYLALTSQKLQGEQVYSSGIANYYVSKDNIDKIYSQILVQINKSNNPKQTIQKILAKYNIGDINKKIRNQQQIDYIFNGKTVKQIYQRALSSSTQFSKNVIKILQKVCPLSVHVIFQLIQQSKFMSFEDVIKRDFIVGVNYSTNLNFQIGVNSLLIKKDNNPKWTHQNLLDVNEEEVKRMFELPIGKKPIQI